MNASREPVTTRTCEWEAKKKKGKKKSQNRNRAGFSMITRLNYTKYQAIDLGSALRIVCLWQWALILNHIQCKIRIIYYKWWSVTHNRTHENSFFYLFIYSPFVDTYGLCSFPKFLQSISFFPSTKPIEEKKTSIPERKLLER